MAGRRHEDGVESWPSISPNAGRTVTCGCLAITSSISRQTLNVGDDGLRKRPGGGDGVASCWFLSGQNSQSETSCHMLGSTHENDIVISGIQYNVVNFY